MLLDNSRTGARIDDIKFWYKNMAQRLDIIRPIFYVIFCHSSTIFTLTFCVDFAELNTRREL